MLQTLRKWRRSLFSQTQAEATPRCVVEPLENRQLLTAAISGISADNRGFVMLNVTQDLNPATVNTKTVQVLVGGLDGKLGTRDDVRKKAKVHYSQATDLITASVNLPVNTRYRVVLIGSKIRGVDGKALDGEFNGATKKSGNGRAGGNYDVSTRVAKTPVARFITSDGIMDVTLFKSQVAKTVNNFISYADEGAWDRTFFHRSIHNFVIQGGGFQVTSTNQIAEIPTHSPILLQAGLHNARGTIAMARTGDPNSATNQFFFNTVDNSGSLDPHPPSNPTSEGYAVFGTLANKASYATMDRLAARPVVDATTDPNIPPPIGGGGQFGLLVTLPILDQAAFDARSTPSQANLDPQADTVKITRVAIKMAISKTA